MLLEVAPKYKPHLKSRFEDEARQLRKIDQLKDEKRMEADTLARKQEEERVREFGRREEEFARQQRLFEEVQQRLVEEQVTRP